MRKLNPIRKASRKRTLGSRRQEEDQAASDDQNDRVGLNEDDSYQPEQFVLSDLQANKQYLQNFFTNASDVIIREARMVNGTSFLVLYVVGLVDTDHIDNRLMAPLMYGPGIENKLTDNQPKTMKDLMELVVSFGQTKSLNSLTEGIDRLITGETLLFIDGFDEVLSLSAIKWEHRLPAEPDTEAVVRGPREGFVEDIRTNTALLRRRIRSPHLKMESFKIGRVTKTDVVLAYIEGIITDSVVDEIRTRLQRIDIDGVIDSGYIEEFIEDQPLSPFPQVLSTERPDTTAGNLLEGRFAILVDGSPFALIAPINLWSFMQANEDYYERSVPASLLRVLRYVFGVIALTLPSMYIAITTIHQEMLPTNLLLSIAAARETTPFPAIVEALLMEITFEALREAGVRLPKAVGQAVSIVGALVIGQAAVQAGIVSAPMVIVVSVTGIANFTIPRYNFAFGIRILRFPLMFLAGTLGLYGIVIGLLCMIIHVSSLRSIGIAYTAPIAPLNMSGMKDIFIRFPWWAMHKRPRSTGYQNRVRIPQDQMPKPPQQESAQREPSQKGGTPEPNV